MRTATLGRARPLVVLALLFPLYIMVSACATHPPAPVPAGPKPAQANRVETFASSVGQRYALVHHPAAAGKNAPLVVVLNGAYGTAAQAKASFGWDAVADRSGFVVAYPNASGPLWNAGDCCGAAHLKDVDDVGFLHQLQQRLERTDGIDPHRVYAVGISNGAMMAYAWACGRPDDVAGIGAVAGALVAPCTPAPAVTVVAVHGTADRNVPINGGVGPLSVTHYRYPPLAATLATFVASDGCGPMPQASNRGPAVRVNTWSCADDRNVVVAVVTGMGHIWPGARPLKTATQRVVHQPPALLDATSFLWSNLRSSELG